MDLSHLPQSVRQLLWVGGAFALITWLSPIVDNAALNNQCMRHNIEYIKGRRLADKEGWNAETKAEAFAYANDVCNQ